MTNDVAPARPADQRPDQRTGTPPGLPPVLLVTGLSGAGKSSALKALEDLGHEAVDNLPLSLLDALLTGTEAGRRLAIGIDVRTRAFAPERLLEIVARHVERPVRILYLDCAGQELVRRFSETRRRHPLAADRPVVDGVALERELLAPLRQVADIVIDTSDFSPHDLRRFMAARFAYAGDRPLTITVISFGFARGLPRDADTVFDMRFLANPHWVEALRDLTGEDPRVRDYVFADPACEQAVDAIMGLLLLLLPRYQAEGRAYVTIAIGCTGGRHRSVAVSSAISDRLIAAGWANNLVHRDTVSAREPAETASESREGKA